MSVLTLVAYYGFPLWLMMFMFFYVIIYRIYIFCSEIVVQTFTYVIYSWFFLLLNYEGFLYTLDKSPLSDT